MGRIEIENFSDKDISRIFIAGSIKEAETAEGILLKPKKSIWDMAGAYSQFATPEEMKKLLDKLRKEDE